jgi:hypothetical protein
MYIRLYVLYASIWFCKLRILIVMFMFSILLCMFRSRYSVSLCCSVYCLCVNAYCTAANGCQTNLLLTNISYINSTPSWQDPFDSTWQQGSVNVQSLPMFTENTHLYGLCCYWPIQCVCLPMTTTHTALTTSAQVAPYFLQAISCLHFVQGGGNNAYRWQHRTFP